MSRWKKWSAQDNEILKANPELNLKELSRKLGRSVRAIRDRETELGLRKPKLRGPRPEKRAVPSPAPLTVPSFCPVCGMLKMSGGCLCNRPSPEKSAGSRSPYHGGILAV